MARESSFLIFNAPEPDTNLKEVRGSKDRELVLGFDECGKGLLNIGSGGLHVIHGHSRPVTLS